MLNEIERRQTTGKININKLKLFLLKRTVFYIHTTDKIPFSYISSAINIWKTLCLSFEITNEIDIIFKRQLDCVYQTWERFYCDNDNFLEKYDELCNVYQNYKSACQTYTSE